MMFRDATVQSLDGRSGPCPLLPGEGGEERGQVGP